MDEEMKRAIELSLNAIENAKPFDFDSVETVMDVNDILSYTLQTPMAQEECSVCLGDFDIG